MKRAKKAAMVTLICSLLTVSLIPTGFVSAEDTSKAKSGDDWLHTKGNKILDKDGNEVWLTGTNWFGFNTGTNCFDGIWSVNMKKAITGMADRGINLLRIPMSVEIIKNWSEGTYPKPNVNDFTNPELKGFNSLQIFDAALKDCQESGIKVMIDIHSAATDAFGHNHPVWYKGSITTDMFYEALEWMADRYKNDDTIVAFDLKNEPHGNPTQASVEYAKWDNSTDLTNWKAVAETAGKKVLAINPKLLIMVEGVEAYPKPGKTYSDHGLGDYYMNWWGGNLRGVKEYPIDLGTNQLVYSPHDYGPLVYAQPWFDKTFTEKTLYDDCWGENWAYINEKDIAPLLIGEWGGVLDGKDNEKWMTLLRDYMIKNHIHHTFWCYNANSGDTGGLVNYDFATWDEAKYALLKPALWQNDSGKFIGLDHEVPLGKNGITVSEYYGNNNNKVKLGDLDNDQTISLIDIMMLKKYILKKISSIPAPDPLKAADFNNDGQINTIDYLLFKKQFTSGT